MNTNKEIKRLTSNLLTTDDVAELLKLSKTKVRQLVRDRKIKSTDFSDGGRKKLYRFKKEWIEEFIADRMVQPLHKQPTVARHVKRHGDRY